MKKIAFLGVLALILNLGILPAAGAEEQKGGDGMPSLSGNIEAGFRSVDTDGSDNKFRQHYNLDTGPRLFNFTLNGNYKTSSILDSFHLQMNNLGGDPYENYSLQVEKNKLYSFRASFRKSDYFYNVANDPHTFDTHRENTDLILTIKPEHFPKLTFGYSKLDKDGTMFLSAFTGFGLGLQPQVALTSTPVDEKEDFYFASAEFSLAIFDFFLEQDYRRSENNYSFFSLDPAVIYNSLEKHELNQPISKVKVHTLLFDQLDLSSTFIYSRSELDVEIGRQQAVLATTGNGSVVKKIWIWDFEASYPLFDSLALHGLGQLSRVTQDGFIFFPPPAILIPAIQATETGTTIDKIFSKTFGFELEYFPISNLTLTAGLKRQLRETEFNRYNHVEPDQGILKTDNTIYVLGFNYKPLASLDLMGKFLIGDLDNPLTHISPTDTENIKLRLRYRPLKNLTLTATHAQKDTENTQSMFKAHSISDSLSIAYQPIEKVELNLGYTVQKADNFSFFNPITSAVAYEILGPVGQFSADSHIISGEVLYAITKKLNVGADIRNLDASGSRPLRFSDLGVLLSYLWPHSLESKIRYQLIEYDEDLTDVNDYITKMVTLSLALNF